MGRHTRTPPLLMSADTRLHALHLPSVSPKQPNEALCHAPWVPANSLKPQIALAEPLPETTPGNHVGALAGPLISRVYSPRTLSKSTSQPLQTTNRP